MDNPILSSDVFKELLSNSSNKIIHEFDWGTMHYISLDENDTLQKKFIAYNVKRGIASQEELEIYFDETSTSDLEFIETYFSDVISIETLMISEVGGSAFTLYLMSIDDLDWTFYTLDGMEFWDVFFKGGSMDDVTSAIIWLYLSDRKPDNYRKNSNFLNPASANIKDTKLQLSHILDQELTHKLIDQSPLSPSFSL